MLFMGLATVQQAMLEGQPQIIDEQGVDRFRGYLPIQQHSNIIITEELWLYMAAFLTAQDYS